MRKKFLELVSQSGKYVVGGLLNTLGTFAIYILLLELIHRSIAFASAFAIGVVFSYNWNRKVVFPDVSRRGNFFSFLPIPTAQLFASLLIIEGAVLIGFEEGLAGLASIAVLTPVAFVLTKYVFKKEPGKSR